MPTAIYPMLATAIEKPFDNPDWLFEIKWDGYRAIAFIDDGRVRFVSRNQNDLTRSTRNSPRCRSSSKPSRAILDGEIVALDDEGRPSFSLMQQRTGFRPGKSRLPGRQGVPVIYYAFDLLYLDGFDLRRVPLEERKQLLREQVIRRRRRQVFPIIIRRRVSRSFKPLHKKGWKESSPKSATACTSKRDRATGSRSKLRSAKSASSAATPIPRAAAPISARSCWGFMTGRSV